MKNIIFIHKQANTVPFVLLFGIYASLGYDPLGSAFFWWLQKEDGLLENLSVIFLIIASLTFALSGFLSKAINNQQKIIFYLMSLTFFVWAGEEISWGERLFNYSNDFISSHNAQGETTVHNLKLIQPFLHYAYFMIFSAFSLLSLSSLYRKKFYFWQPDGTLFYFFSIPAGYYGLGIILSYFPEVSSAPFDNQELYEFVFATGIAIYSYDVFYILNEQN